MPIGRDFGDAAHGRGHPGQHLARHIRHHQFPPADLECEDVGERAGGGEAAAGHDRDPPAERFRIRQDVRAEKNGAPLIAQLENERAHVAASAWIETGHRLVEKHHLRIVQQRLRDADPLNHALGELAQLQLPLAPDANAIEQRRDARLAFER